MRGDSHDPGDFRLDAVACVWVNKYSFTHDHSINDKHSHDQLSSKRHEDERELSGEHGLRYDLY